MKPRPEWASTFNYKAHSPSGARRTDCKECFEKVVARPNNLRDPASCNMLGGIVCEEYAKNIVIADMDAAEAFRHCVSRFQEHRVQEHQKNDAANHALICDGVYEVKRSKAEKDAEAPVVSGTFLELTARNTADGLREATQGANSVTDGRWASIMLEDNELYHTGEIDVEAHGGVVEIKTMWPSVSDTKQGFRIKSLPAKPDPFHVRQVALYWHWLRQSSENEPVKIVYSNCIGYRIFSSENCRALSQNILHEKVQQLALIARTRENLMKTAGNKEQLFSLVRPNFDDWMWANVPPEYRRAANELWGTE